MKFDSQAVFEDPMITPDGHSYEKAAIHEWLKEHRTSPASGALLPPGPLIPNTALKKAIQRLRHGEQPAAEPVPFGAYVRPGRGGRGGLSSSPRSMN